MSVLFEYNFSFPFIPHSYQNVTSPTLSPKPLSFLAPPPIRSKSASRTAYQIPKRNTIAQTPHQKQAKKQYQDLHPQNPKGNPSKRHSKTIHQTPPTRKHPHPDSHPNPPRIRTNPSQNPYTPKRKYVFPQTQVHFTPNAEEFASKRKGVSPKTQGRLTTNASPFSAPKSLRTRSPCLQIPPNLSISHPSHPLQKPSERGSLSNLSRESPQKQNQKATQITTQAAKRNQTTQTGIIPKIRYKAPESSRSKPSFFPSPSYKMHEKVCSFHKK